MDQFTRFFLITLMVLWGSWANATTRNLKLVCTKEKGQYQGLVLHDRKGTLSVELSESLKSDTSLHAPSWEKVIIHDEDIKWVTGCLDLNNAYCEPSRHVLRVDHDKNILSILTYHVLVGVGPTLRLHNYLFELPMGKYMKHVSAFTVHEMFQQDIGQALNHPNFIETGNCRLIQSNDDQKKIASYLGVASYCVAYGIDFSALASKIVDGILDFSEFDPSFSQKDFLETMKQGSIGKLYSPATGLYVDLTDSGVDPFESFKKAHVEVIKISQIK